MAQINNKNKLFTTV